jgi:hypothetical protein
MAQILIEVIKDAAEAGAKIKCVVQDMGTQNIAALKKLGVSCTRKNMNFKVICF